MVIPDPTPHETDRPGGTNGAEDTRSHDTEPCETNNLTKSPTTDQYTDQDGPREVTAGGCEHQGPEPLDTNSTPDPDHPNNESRGGDMISLSRSSAPDITPAPDMEPDQGDDQASDREQAGQRGRLARWEAERAFAHELEELPAGPELATRVVRWAGLGDSSESMMVEMIAALGRCVANLEGLRAHMVWHLVQTHGDSTVETRAVCEEIALRIGHTHAVVSRMVDLGMTLAETPALADAMRQGHIGSAKAHQVMRDTDHLDPEQRHHVITDVMNHDPQTRNLPDLRRLTRTLTEWINPEDATTKHARARANRAVWIDKAAHGMALLHAYLPATHAYQIYATLTTMALAVDPAIATSPEATPHAPPPATRLRVTPAHHARSTMPAHQNPGTPPLGPEPGTMPICDDPGAMPATAGPGTIATSDDRGMMPLDHHPGAIHPTGDVATGDPTGHGPLTTGPIAHNTGIDDPFPDEPVAEDEVPPEHDTPTDIDFTTDIDIPWVEDVWDDDPANIQAAEVTRTLGNRRADALVDLFSPTGSFTTGKPFDAVRPRLVVVARAEALLGSDHFPGELIGYGSLPAHAVREIAQDSTWQAIYQDPQTGRMAAAGTQLLPPGIIAPTNPAGDRLATLWPPETTNQPHRTAAHCDPGSRPTTMTDTTSPLHAPSRSDPDTPANEPDTGSPPLAPSPISPTTSDPAHPPSCPDPGAHLGVAGVAPPGPAWVFPPDTWPAETLACHSYQPSPHLQNTITLRDLTCSFTGCQRPAWACDLDHIQPFDPGLPAIDQTIASNLTPACRIHHRLKTLTEWDWTRDTHTGILTITSPQGRIYRIQPPTPTTPPWRNNPDW
ncbi:MAG: DUF222 domain-containing protein [Bifidobacteriaceae bacterium]|nr:DUF222 domain-containing protein [Bifidobacteriaceae bacterium]